MRYVAVLKQVTLNNNTTLTSVIAGCMRMTQMDEHQICSFVEGCLELGIDSFDHAPVYGSYTIEEHFGKAILKDTPSMRSKIKLISKTGIVLPKYDHDNTIIYYRNEAQWILPEVERSLKKLHTDYLDVLLVHRFDPLADPAALGKTLDQLVDQGKVKNVGVSNYTPTAINALQKYMRTPLVTNQVELSVKKPEILFNDIADDALLKEMPIMAWSPLGGGDIFREMDPQSQRIKMEAERIAKKYDTTPDVILYAWVLRLPQKIMLITGTMNLAHIQSAIEAENIELTYDEWYGLLSAGRGFDVP